MSEQNINPNEAVRDAKNRMNEIRETLQAESIAAFIKETETELAHYKGLYDQHCGEGKNASPDKQ